MRQLHYRLLFMCITYQADEQREARTLNRCEAFVGRSRVDEDSDHRQD